MGQGLSLRESCIAVKEVAYGLFGRSWSNPDKDSESFDLDTLPEKPNIVTAVNLVEVETLFMTASKIMEAKEADHIVTHDIDSTTKKGA